MKKLIPALCMLLIAAALLGTSTYAWFSMNSSVTAEGMTVTAKSDTVFLQISKDGSFSNDGAQVTDSVDKTATGVALKPTALATAIVDDAKSITKPTGVSDPYTSFSSVKFVEAFSADPDASAKREGSTYTEVATAKTPGNAYTHINSFYVRLNAEAGAPSVENLRVTGVSVKSVAITKDGSGNVTAIEDKGTANNALLGAVRVLVVCDEDWTLWDSTGTTAIASSKANNVISATLTSEKKEVKIYVYFDGEDAVTKSTNAALLGADGYMVGVTFNVGT